MDHVQPFVGRSASRSEPIHVYIQFAGITPDSSHTFWKGPVVI
jgi:hypothetical protein